MRNRIEQVLRSGAPMTASPCQYIGNRFKRLSAGIKRRGAVHNKSQGRYGARGCFYGNPAWHAVGRLVGELAPEELSELALKIILREFVQNAPALSATIKRHHQAGLLKCAPKASDVEAEGAMPPPGEP